MESVRPPVRLVYGRDRRLAETRGNQRVFLFLAAYALFLGIMSAMALFVWISAGPRARENRGVCVVYHELARALSSHYAGILLGSVFPLPWLGMEHSVASL